MKNIKYFIVSLSVFTPFIASAETTKKLSDLISTLADYLNQILALLMGFAVVAFVFYIIKYFISSSDDTKRAEAASYVMWSMVGFFVILSIWGIVNVLIQTFDLGTGSPGSWVSLSKLFPS